MKNPSIEKQLKTLSRISNAIVSDFYLEDILRLIVTVTAEMMGSRICSLMLIDENTKELVIRATQSMSEEYNKKSPLRIGEGIAGKVVKNNKPMIVMDVTKEKEYRHKDIAKSEGLCSLLCVPMAVRGKVIGVFNCYTSKPHHFSETEVNVLTTISNQAAVAIENAELSIKSKIIEGELEARKKIERAKGILMKEEGLTEEAAYLKLQRYSMNNRKSLREVAEAIILAADIKK